MQKGKALHRALPLIPPNGVVITAIFLISLCLSEEVPGMSLRGLPPDPRRYIDPCAPLVRGRYALCFSSCSEPYGIGDLRIYRALAGMRAGGSALWALWDACSHPLYRLDGLGLRACLRPFGLPASIALEPRLRREAVKGFPPAYTAGCGAALVLSGRDVACLLKRGIMGMEGSNFTLLSISVRVDGFSLTAACRSLKGSVSLVDVVGGVSFDGIASMRTGYRPDTGEIRFGLDCRRGRIVVKALWAHHPVLGRTISLGVGCLWAG